MNRPLAVLFALAACAAACAAQNPPLIEGRYIGWRPLKEMTAHDEEGGIWFRVHRLTVKGDQIEIEASPMMIKGGEVLASASDGGFLTYKGKLYRKDKQVRIKMRVVRSDYVGVPSDGWPELDLPIAIKDKVSFTLDDVSYTLRDAGSSVAD